MRPPLLRTGGLTLALGLLASLAASAETVVCHVTYGGETRRLFARPVATPYTVAPVAFGSYFLFRSVFEDKPDGLAAIKLYTYADRPGGPVIIHQASYPYPVRNAAVNGFTGQQFVYEPIRDSELQYWCEIHSEVATK